MLVENVVNSRSIALAASEDASNNPRSISRARQDEVQLLSKPLRPLRIGSRSYFSDLRLVFSNTRTRKAAVRVSS